MAKGKRRQHDWPKITAEWNREKGRVSVSDFCRVRDIPTASFHNMLARTKGKKTKHLNGFVRVGGGEMIELETTKGTKLRVPPSALKEVLEVLE